MLISESPMEGIGGKKQQQLSKLMLWSESSVVNFKNSVQGLNLNLCRNYSQEILFKQPKWFWWPAKVETSEVRMGVGVGAIKVTAESFKVQYLIFIIYSTFFSNCLTLPIFLMVNKWRVLASEGKKISGVPKMHLTMFKPLMYIN